MSGTAGRPRDAAVAARVIDATLAVLEERGLGGLSIDGVAARAGVGKATIYRRWNSKEQLIVDAIGGLAEDVETRDTGDLHADLVAVATRMCRFMYDTRAGCVFPQLAGELQEASELGRRYRAEVLGPKRAAVAHLIETAIARGAIRPDIDLELATDMIVGPLVARRLTGAGSVSCEEWATKLIDALLDGWRA